MASEPKCKHEEFDAAVVVNRLEDSGRFMADVKIKCVQCGVPMVFLGLPRGFDMNSAATDLHGTELRAAIHPFGETVPELALGYQVRGPIEGGSGWRVTD